MFLYSHWLSLPIATRNKIADEFHIQKKGSTEVFNNTIKSDGYLVQDVESILNVDALQKFLMTDITDMAVLFPMMVERIENPITIPMLEVNIVQEEKSQHNEAVIPVKKKLGRPKKK